MPIEVTMPKLSPTMESGVITQWLVKVGDQVKEGDLLADVETDKATMAMTSYDDGIVAHLDHNVGDEVALGQRVLVLAKKGEDPKKVAASLGGQKSAPAGSAKAGATPTPAAPTHAAPTNGQESHVAEVEPEVVEATAAGAPAGSSRARWRGRSRRPRMSTWAGSRGAAPAAG